MNNVYVLISSSNGSGFMKKNLFKESNVKIIDNLNNLNCENQIFLIIKYFDELDSKFMKKLKKLKEKNIIFYEFLDKTWKFKIPEVKKIYNNYKKIFDYIIFSSKSFMNIFQNSNFLKFNYHEYDISLCNNTNQRSDNLIYLGSRKKSSFSYEMFSNYNINYIQKKYNGNPCIHIDYVKKNHTYYIQHTSTKLATSLGQKSIFICNKIPIYLEILGDDYKFFFKDDLSNMNEIISKAKNTILDNDLYKSYLDEMDKYRILLSPHTILNNYMKIFNSV